MTGSGVRRVSTEAELADALAVRHAVFVEGQGVPEARERDGKDGEAVHFLACDDGRAIGTARLREIEPGVGKIERVAVRETRRGEGWGQRLLAAVETEARERGLSALVLHSQTHVEEFYAALGYETVGGEFEDAGIPHVEMRKSLGDRNE